MYGGPLLLLLLAALALGSVAAVAYVVVQLHRRGRGERALMIVGGLAAILVGAAAVLLGTPHDRRAFVVFDSRDGEPIRVVARGQELGTTPLQCALGDLSVLAGGQVPIGWSRSDEPLPPAPTELATDAPAIRVHMHVNGMTEGLTTQRDPDVPGRTLVRPLAGPDFPGHAQLLELHTTTPDDEPARIQRIEVELTGLLGKGPRVYRVVLGAP